MINHAGEEYRAEQPYHLNIYLFLSVLMLCDYDYLALETRAEKICREILSVYYFKIQPLLLLCSILLSLFTLKTNTSPHARDEKYF